MSFLFLFGLVLTAQSQTVDEVFAKFEAAVGGRDALLAIKTVQYKSTITLNMMGSPFDIPVTNIKENNKCCAEKLRASWEWENHFLF